MHFKLNFTLLIIISASSRVPRRVCSIMKTKRLPESEPMMVPPNMEPKIPDHCRNRSFCEDVPNYPYEYINYLLKNNVTVRNAMFLPTGGFDGSARCKKDKDPKNAVICQSEMKYIQAKAARHSSGQWYFVVGDGGQGICEELCTSGQNNENCIGPIIVDRNYKATCKQRKINIPIAALNENGRIVIKHPFLYDGCWCHVRRKEKVIV